MSSSSFSNYPDYLEEQEKRALRKSQQAYKLYTTFQDMEECPNFLAKATAKEFFLWSKKRFNKIKKGN